MPMNPAPKDRRTKRIPVSLSIAEKELFHRARALTLESMSEFLRTGAKERALRIVYGGQHKGVPR